MRFLFSGRARVAALIVAVVGVAAAGIAYAAIPDTNGVIHGCYAKDGTLRVIDTEAGAACTKKENPLSWNQTGPTGPPGIGAATTFTATFDQDNVEHTLATLDNGITVAGICQDANNGGNAVVVIEDSTGDHLQVEGYKLYPGIFVYTDNELARIHLASDPNLGVPRQYFFGLARDSSTGGKFAHLDLRGLYGSPCSFSGMIIPSS